MKKVICWFSGGVTSAVACKKALELYGVSNCEFWFIDTRNEDPDTYRFKSDCEKWYGAKINTLSAIPDEYANIQDVWRTHLSLNVSFGAVCSNKLKREVRLDFQREHGTRIGNQVFGYEFNRKEMNRALSMALNNPDAKPIFPLLMFGLDKPACLEIVARAGIRPPNAYALGLHNNNCLQTGCVQGGVGYWQHLRRIKPKVFEAMAAMEHELTDKKGYPVTMLKDQSKEAKALPDKKDALVFLLPHPKYPQNKSLADMKPQKIKPLFECNGFCGTNDLAGRSTTEQEINYEDWQTLEDLLK